MLRLLWKEFHEAKWYLLSLLALPWVVSLWCILQKGVGAKDTYDACFWVCALPLVFLASTRMQKDMQPNQLSADWLPVNRWVGLFAKLAPGLAVAVLLPIWLRLVVTICAGETVPLDYLMMAVASSIYAFTFAVSMFLPGLPSALVGVAIDMIACGWSIKALPPYFPREVVVGALALMAVTACIGVWVQTERSSIKRRAGGALTGIAVGLIPVLGIGFLFSMHTAGGMKEFRVKRNQYLAQRKSKDSGRGSMSYASGGLQVSLNGRSIAFVKGVRGDSDNGTELVVADIDGQETTVPGSTASSAAWLRDGDLLVFTGMIGSGIHLNRYYRRENRLARLASFPSCRGDHVYTRPIISVVPDPLSDRVALVVMPPSGGLPDLWVLDAHKGNPRLVRRNIATKWEGNYITWSGDSIIMVRQSEYCRIPLDGSRPRFITDSGKEVRHD